MAESDSTVEVCVTLTTSPMTPTLATQVDLTLSTIDGTGMLIIYFDDVAHEHKNCYSFC